METFILLANRCQDQVCIMLASNETVIYMAAESQV